MSNLDIIFTFVVIINLGAVMAQSGINEINPQQKYINCTDTILNLGGCYVQDTSTAYSDDGIPTANIEATGGNGFTDIFNTIGKWFKSGFGQSILGKIFAVYTLLSWTGMSGYLVGLIGSAWYLFSFFAVIEWWRGIG